jgi:hypothetical protein
MLREVVRSAQFSVSSDAPLHVSDDGLATLIHVHMLDADDLRAAMAQTPESFDLCNITAPIANSTLESRQNGHGDDSYRGSQPVFRQNLPDRVYPMGHTPVGFMNASHLPPGVRIQAPADT